VNVVGSGRRPPLLVLHGGPGAGHDYLEPLGDLATDRPVVLYDQLGCGRSDKPDNPALWTVNRFVAEIDAVRRALNLKHHHLYGHSWGGWLAIEYLLRPSTHGIGAVVLASTSGSAAQYVAGTQYLRTLLPADVQPQGLGPDVRGAPHPAARPADPWPLRRVRRALHRHSAEASSAHHAGRVPEQRAHGHVGGTAGLHSRRRIVPLEPGPRMNDRPAGSWRLHSMAAGRTGFADGHRMRDHSSECTAHYPE
jgi:pimeloyl-ACP methyl ester carboxylesterase